MKRLLIVIALIFVFGGLLSLWFYIETRPTSTTTSFQDFLIVKGSSASDIGDKLAKAGLIKSSLAFKVYVQVTGSQKRIQAGVYRLSPSSSLSGIVRELLKGPVEIWVTIPEGLRREEITERLISAFSPESPAGFRREFLSLSEGKEGFLFPDTYLFPRTATASGVIKKMLAVFDKRVDANTREDIGKSDFSLSQIITLASIIERETKTDQERPVVAGILLKRLEADWLLQADATLQYVVANSKLKTQNSKLENWWEPVTKDDLNINTPYNTYKYQGLPPTPIANPGLSSIKAVVYPEDSPYWFYLHDASGQIHYAGTIEEHNQNIQKYLGK